MNKHLSSPFGLAVVAVGIACGFAAADAFTKSNGILWGWACGSIAWILLLVRLRGSQQEPSFESRKYLLLTAGVLCIAAVLFAISSYGVTGSSLEHHADILQLWSWLSVLLSLSSLVAWFTRVMIKL